MTKIQKWCKKIQKKEEKGMKIINLVACLISIDN